MALELSGKQRRHLRGLGHELRFLVQVGRQGITPTVVQSVADALAAHELVKIKFGKGFEGDLATATAELAAGTDSAEAGRIGRTALLYRPDPDKPRIVLPAGRD